MLPAPVVLTGIKDRGVAPVPLFVYPEPTLITVRLVTAPAPVTVFTRATAGTNPVVPGFCAAVPI